MLGKTILLWLWRRLALIRRSIGPWDFWETPLSLLLAKPPVVRGLEQQHACFPQHYVKWNGKEERHAVYPNPRYNRRCYKRGAVYLWFFKLCNSREWRRYLFTQVTLSWKLTLCADWFTVSFVMKYKYTFLKTGTRAPFLNRSIFPWEKIPSSHCFKIVSMKCVFNKYTKNNEHDCLLGCSAV
jgi:hypothetical protein